MPDPTDPHVLSAAKEGATDHRHAAASVHPHETDSPPDSFRLREESPPREDFAVTPISLHEATFRHSGWMRRRRQTWAALNALHVSRSRLNRFANCGSGCIVEYCHELRQYRLSANYCHDRWCLPCATARAHLIARQLASVMTDSSRPGDHPPFRLITLTLKHRPVSLSAQIDRLYACYNTLRRRPIWKLRTRGAAAFLEFKLAGDGSDWHPHLHVIATGQFIPHADLARNWFEITGDSSIVDIRLIRDPDEVAADVVKYAAKAADHVLWDNPEKLAEAIAATKGRKLCSTSGGWRGLQLRPKADTSHRWVRINSLDAVIVQADQGNVQCRNILDAIRPTWIPDSS